MKANLRPQRDAEIVRLWRAKVSQAEIGRRVGLNGPRVHEILVAAGVIGKRNPADHAPKLGGEGIWAATDERRRAAFYRRQREGARAALEAMT